RLQSFYSKLANKPRADGKPGLLSPTTVRYTYSVLNIALRRAVRLALIPRNPADGTDPPKAAKTEQRAFTDDEARRFLKSVKDDRLSALYWLALALGLRRGELLGLRWQDLDLDKALLHVRQSLVAVKGRPVIQAPKTDRGRRTLELTPQLVAIIKRYRVQQAKAKLFFGEEYKDHGLVFPTEFGEAMAPRSLTRQFERRLEKAGLPRIRFHDLRHTFASLAFPDTDLKTVSAILGHDDISTTADIYSHVLHGHQRRAIKKVVKQITSGPDD
ncbi:MAG TPA: site-specific integrase, partial [Bacillota bacterium]